jgi:hypothetical protein
MPEYDANKMISYDEFEILCNAKQRYEGFVEGTGYAYWIPEEIYFITVGRKKYQQIMSFQIYSYSRAGYAIITKTKYNLYIISPEYLKKMYSKVFEQYAKLVNDKKEKEIIENLHSIPVAKNDAIQPPNHPISHGRVIKSTEKNAMEEISKMEDAVGLILDVYNTFSKKKIPVIDNFLTAVSIVNDIDNGEYLSAGGNLIKALSGWYETVWDIGTMIYESDRFIIEDYHLSKQEYIIRKATYEKNNSNWNRRLMEDALKNFSRTEKRYNELINKKQYHQ